MTLFGGHSIEEHEFNPTFKVIYVEESFIFFKGKNLRKKNLLCLHQLYKLKDRFTIELDCFNLLKMHSIHF